MLAGMKRHRDIRHPANLMRPHARTIDNMLAFYRDSLATLRGNHAAHPAILLVDRIYPGMFDDRGTHGARTLGKCQRDIGRICLAVLLNPDSPGYIADFKMRIAVLRLGGRNLFDSNAIGTRHRGIAIQLFLALGSQRHGNGTGCPHTGGNAGFRLEIEIKIGRIFREPGHVGGGTQLPDQPRGMPGRAAGQLLAFQQHNVFPAKPGKMIGDRTTRHAPADDDDTGLLRK